MHTWKYLLVVDTDTQCCFGSGGLDIRAFTYLAGMEFANEHQIENIGGLDIISGRHVSFHISN